MSPSFTTKQISLSRVALPLPLRLGLHRRTSKKISLIRVYGIHVFQAALVCWWCSWWSPLHSSWETQRIGLHL